jgi:hypothetical protein
MKMNTRDSLEIVVTLGRAKAYGQGEGWRYKHAGVGCGLGYCSYLAIPLTESVRV